MRSFLIFVFLIFALECKAQKITTASWYSYASARREGTSGIMANGSKMDDNRFTCASWDYPLGTKLLVSNVKAKRNKIVVTVTDRGPARKYYRRGRTIDLSKSAFAAIADLRDGLCKIFVEKI